LVNTDNQSVPDDPGKHIIAKKPHKVIESYPPASPYTVYSPVVTESYLCAVHRPISKNEKPYNGKEDDEPELIIIPPNLPEVFWGFPHAKTYPLVSI
jgi:hypothetical protein